MNCTKKDCKYYNKLFENFCCDGCDGEFSQDCISKNFVKFTNIKTQDGAMKVKNIDTSNQDNDPIKPMNVKEIIKKYLEENGFDGLYNSMGYCGCGKEDLFDRNFCNGCCVPAYKCDCERDRCEFSACYTADKNRKCVR